MISVLYVDDEVELLEIAKLFLESSGEFSVAVSSSANESFESSCLQSFDAIISDYQMPDLDGIAFLKKVRERYGDLPFILFTGRGREEVVIEAINNGADFYIQKGGDPRAQFAELSHKIRMAVERRRAERSRIESEKRLADIINFLPDATFAINRDGDIIAWNRAIEQMTGIPASQMIGKGDHEYSLPFYGDRRKILIDLIFESDEVIKERYSHIVRENDALMADTSLPHLRGVPVTLFGKASPLYNSSGEIAGAIESIRDITAWTRAEDELRSAYSTIAASEEKYRDLFENSVVGIFRTTLEGKFSAINTTFARIAGYSSAAEMMEAIHDVRTQLYVNPEDRDRFIRTLKNDGAMKDFTAQFRHRDGHTVWILINARAVRDPASNIRYYEGTIEDITEQKKVEDALRREKIFSEAVLDSIPGLLYLYDSEGRLVRWNRAHETITGYSARELDGMHVLDWFVGDNESTRAVSEGIGRALQEGQASAEALLRTKDGKKIPFIFTARRLEIDNRIYFTGVGIDISERRTTEDELRAAYEQITASEEELRGQLDVLADSEKKIRASEAWFHAVFEKSSDALLVTENGRLVHCNERALSLFGYRSITEIAEIHAPEASPEFQPDGRDSRTAAEDHIRAAYENGEERFEWVHKRKDGSTFPAEVLLSRFDIEQRTFLQSSIRDITERKLAETALKESEENYRRVTEFSPFGMHFYELRPGGDLVFAGANPAADRILGLDHGGLVGKAIDEAFPGLVGTEIPSAYRTIAKAGGIWHTDQITYDEGQIRGAFSVHAFQIREGLMVAAFQDITERKQAEEALRQSEEKFRDLITVAPVPLSFADPEGNVEFLNTMFTRVFGYTREDIPTINAWFLKAYPDPEYRKQATESWRAAMKRAADGGMTIGPREYRVTCKDGSVKNVLISGTLLEGKLLAIMIDITERRQAEEALQRSEEKYHELVENANSIITKWDKNGRITFFNEFAQRVFGFTTDEVIGKPVVGTIVPATESGSERDLRAMIDDIIRRPENYVLNENENITKDGRRVWIQWHNKALIDENGQFAGLLSIGTDITERRTAEEALQKAHDDLERKVLERTEALRESEERLRLKLDSVLFSHGEIDDLDLVNIIDIPIIQSLMEEFSLLTGMGTAILDLRGTVIEASGWQDICQKFHRVHERTAQYCRESDLYLAQNVKPGEYVAYRCKNHLWDVITPLYIGNRHVGNIYTGQFFYDDEVVDESFFAARAVEYGFDTDAYLSALRCIPRFSHAQIEHLMGFLVKLTGLVSKLSYSNLKLARATVEEKNVREALSRSERRLFDIIDHLPDATLAIDADGHVIAWNQAMEEMTGIRSEDILGKGNYEYSLPFYGYRRPILIDWIFNPHDELEKVYTIKKQEGSVIVAEVDLDLPSGRSITLWGKATALHDPDGNLVGAIESIRDVTERRKAEAELKTLYNELEERVIERTKELSQAQAAYKKANEKLNLLSGITRHDIRNQLLTLTGFLEFSKECLSDPSRLEGFIDKELRIARTIDHQISFTKDYEDMGVKAPSWQNVAAVAGRAQTHLTLKTVSVDPGDPTLEIFADPLLEKVFYNIFENALRYGGEEMTSIRVSNIKEGSTVTLIIEDDGQGVAPDDKPHIFEQGYGKNTGLGLFLVREILSLTGISIRETGEPKKGARFELAIPEGGWRFVFKEKTVMP